MCWIRRLGGERKGEKRIRRQSVKTLKLWTGKIRVSDGKGKGSADISEREDKAVCGKLGFRGPWKVWGGNRRV